MQTATRPGPPAARDASLVAFHVGMSLPERRTFWACAAG